MAHFLPPIVSFVRFVRELLPYFADKTVAESACSGERGAVTATLQNIALFYHPSNSLILKARTLGARGSIVFAILFFGIGYHITHTIAI